MRGSISLPLNHKNILMACNLTTGFNQLQEWMTNAGGITDLYIGPISAKGNLTFSSGSVTNVSTFFSTGSSAQFFHYVPRKTTAEATSDMKVSQVNGSQYF